MLFWGTVAMGAVLTPESIEWRLPGDAAVWMQDNTVLQVNATQPHHTTVDLLNGARMPQFLMTLRVKVLDWAGSPPGIYFYMHRHAGGLQAAALGRDGLRLMGWYGKDEPGTSSVKGGIGYEKGVWLRLKLICRGSNCVAKVWRDGETEPRWQVEHSYAKLKTTAPGLGVWTHPQIASTATVQFADVEILPLTDARLAEQNVPAASLTPLPPEQIPTNSGCFRAGGMVGIRGARLAMAFDPADGRPTTIRDLVSGQEFAAPAALWGLFHLGLRSADHLKLRTLSARDFLKLESTCEPGSDTLTMQFTECLAGDVSVACNVTVGPDGELRFSAETTVKTGEHVASLRYPELPCRPTLAGDGSDDALIIPSHEGVVIHQPGTQQMSRSNVYPEASFAQFAAYYGQTGGLYVAAHDPAGHCKRIHTMCAKGRFVCTAWEHLFPEDGSETAAMPYDIVVDRVEGGDWRHAADRYKAWAKSQPWCAKTLDQRDDIPAFLTDATGILIDGIRNPKGLTQKYGPNMERLPDVLDQYREATGLKHIVFIPYGWENRGTWAGIHYLPAFPSNAFWADMAAELKRRGNRVGMLTSGFWWVVKRQTNGNGPGFDDSADLERLGDMCIRNADGTLYEADHYDQPQGGASWRGLSVRLCHGSKDAQKNLTDTFMGVARLGVPLVSFDQEIGGGMPVPCYDTRHGHAPGFGNYPWTGLEDTCKAILSKGKTVEPELGLFMENTSEVAIPYMCTYWSRQFAEVHNYGGRNEGIALFSYLYHEYVTAIGAACVQGQGEAPTKEMRGRILANNLVRGLIPGPFIHQVPLESGKEWHQYVTRAYLAFCKPYRHFSQFLLRGRTLHPPKLTCARVTTAFHYVDHKNGKKRWKHGKPLSPTKVDFDAVGTGAFEAGDGRRLVLVVNATGSEQTATVELPAGHQWQEYALDGKPGDAKLTSGTQHLDLTPFECRLYVAPAPMR
jgi:hypothetical protein